MRYGKFDDYGQCLYNLSYRNYHYDVGPMTTETSAASTTTEDDNVEYRD